MYIGTLKIKDYKIDGDTVDVTIKQPNEDDVTKMTINKKLFDLISSEEIENNGETVQDVIEFNISCLLAVMLSDYGLNITQALGIITRTTELILNARDSKAAKLLDSKHIKSVPISKFIDEIVD